MKARAANLAGLCVAVVLTWADSAAAEVMDKQPSIESVWAAAAVISLVALLAAAWHPIAGMAALIAAIPMDGNPLIVWDEVSHPWMGPDIAAEAPFYPPQVGLAVQLVLGSYLAGSFLWWLRRRPRVRKAGP